MRGRVYSREFKLSVVRQLASGEKRPAQVCREHSVAESVLARWRKQYELRGEAAFVARTADDATSWEQKMAELERFCGHLALENHMLKKALQAAPSRSDMP